MNRATPILLSLLLIGAAAQATSQYDKYRERNSWSMGGSAIWITTRSATLPPATNQGRLSNQLPRKPQESQP